jgi:predicted GNAT family acetyltransferase
MAGLPGKYARPTGRLLLALRAGEPAGCVAQRGLDSNACEMKRMFVTPRLQGGGVGRALAEAVIAEARAQGYETMWLDTSIRQAEAQARYRSLDSRSSVPTVTSRLTWWTGWCSCARTSATQPQRTRNSARASSTTRALDVPDSARCRASISRGVARSPHIQRT